MKYSEHLRKVFKDTNLQVEDLLLLEDFQIKSLPDRVPSKEFATLLRTYPNIHKHLIEKEPDIKHFLDNILNENKSISNPQLIEEYCDEVLWEIGELIVYNKFPEVYDSKITFTWKIEEIVSPRSLKNKFVADIGAGTGMLSFLLSEYAKTVYAVEPLSSFRRFMRQKLNTKKIRNICIEKGFLDNIPLPRHSVDYLFTSNALGWNFEKEQQEIHRVVKSNGKAIHLMRAFDKDAASPHHDQLIDWGYKYEKFESDGFKARYIKSI